MRCSPLRWLWGLVPLAVLWGLTLLSLQPLVESDLASRIARELASKGLDWASATVVGRDVELTGRGADDGELKEAARIARETYGVRIVDDKTSLIDKADTYIWTASLRDRTVKLSGFVPSEEVRRTMLGMAKAKFPGRDIQDLTKLARGSPPRDVWTAGLGFALDQLSHFKRGSVELEGTALSVDGETDDAKSYSAVMSALDGRLPKSITLRTEKVRPPVASPYVWSATAATGRIMLAGSVPSGAVRRALESEAKRQFAKHTLTDTLEFASGEPRAFEAAAIAALKGLAQLEDGKVEIRDAAISVTGLAESQAIADAVKKGIREGSPTMRHSEQIRVKVDEEAIARAKAEAEARQRAEAEARQKAEAEAKARVEAEAARKAEEADARARADAEARQKAELEARARAQADAKQKAEAEARQKSDAEARARAQAEAKRKAEADAVEQTRRAAAVKQATQCKEQLARVATEGVINFERASATLTPQSFATLDRLVAVVKTCPVERIEIEGHTDAEGAPERNQPLSERRAQSVVGYLVRAGIEPGLLAAIGYGAQRPIASNDTPEGRARNRRIEFEVKPKL